MMMTEPLDAITLEVWWSRLVAIADEAATTLLRTAFSTIIRESNDYTVVLMNTSGQTIAECRAGIPGFAALMSVLTGRLLAKFPAESWRSRRLVHFAGLGAQRRGLRPVRAHARGHDRGACPV
jgi:N-methylhydantoinase B